MRAFFESLEMGAADAWTLFASLDADGDNVISVFERNPMVFEMNLNDDSSIYSQRSAFLG